jgi:hypothetical protein
MTLTRLLDTIAQHVFRSPARIPAAEPLADRPRRRAAKRKTLYVIIRENHAGDGQGSAVLIFIQNAVDHRIGEIVP